MDIDQLRAFVAVAESGSFSEASRVLYLTQPAISKRIASLESELANPLFDRIGRQVHLTEAGQVLIPHARHILREIQDSRRALSELSGEVAGILHIGTSHHIGLHRLPPVLKQFTAAYPQVQLDLNFMDSEAACQAVQQGHLELGIVTLPLGTRADLEQRYIWDDPMAFMVANNHPLASRKHATLESLAEHAAVLPSTGTYTRELVERTLSPHGIKLKVSMSTNYLETIKMLVSVGLGWSVLPQSMASKDVTVVKVKNIEMRRRLGVVWHSRRTLSNAARVMMEVLAKDFGKN